MHDSRIEPAGMLRVYGNLILKNSQHRLLDIEWIGRSNNTNRFCMHMLGDGFQEDTYIRNVFNKIAGNYYIEPLI